MDQRATAQRLFDELVADHSGEEIDTITVLDVLDMMAVIGVSFCEGPEAMEAYRVACRELA